jgi:hypothetical protein
MHYLFQAAVSGFLYRCQDGGHTEMLYTVLETQSDLKSKMPGVLKASTIQSAS